MMLHQRQPIQGFTICRDGADILMRSPLELLEKMHLVRSKEHPETSDTAPRRPSGVDSLVCVITRSRFGI